MNWQITGMLADKELEDIVNTDSITYARQECSSVHKAYLSPLLHARMVPLCQWALPFRGMFAQLFPEEAIEKVELGRRPILAAPVWEVLLKPPGGGHMRVR